MNPANDTAGDAEWKETIARRKALMAALEADNKPAIDFALQNLGYQAGEAGLRLFCLHLERSELAAWDLIHAFRLDQPLRRRMT